MSEAAPATPREWVGPAPFPWPPARSLADGDRLRACFCLVDVTVARTRQDQPYLRLTLTDRHGPLEARVWENALAAAESLRPGVYIGVQGRVERFNGTLQLCVDEFEPVRVLLEDLALFLPRSRRSDEEMADELASYIASIDDRALRDLLERLLGEHSEVGQAFRLAPAAKHNHHAYLGGLLEHTLSVTAVCHALADHYGDRIDRDLLLTGALLHDVGKVREIGARAGFPYTDEGKLLGHILLGLQMVHAAAAGIPGLEPARLLLLEHLVAAHQGRYEWQSPREPMILEGLILHYADDLDAKLQQVGEMMERTPGAWTPYDRGFRRDFLRHAPTPESQPLPHGTQAERPENADAGGAQAGATPNGNARESDPAAAPAEPDPTPRESGQAPMGDDGAGEARDRSYPDGVLPRLSEDTLDLFGQDHA